MATKFDTDQFLRSILRPPFTEECRKRAWNHQQHLDSLSDFSKRLQYWRDEVSKEGIIYDTIYSEEPGFILSPNPQTEEDLRLLSRFRLDWYRARFIKRKERTLKFGWKGFRDDPDGTAFFVQALDKLKADLDLRLITSTRPIDLLKRELHDITTAIDAGEGFEYVECVDKLRQSIDTNRPVDLLYFEDTTFGSPDISSLAKIWDIVHYEAHLKNCLGQYTFAPDAFASPPEAAPQLYLESSGQKVTKEQTYCTFAELFTKPTNEDTCVDALRKFDEAKPILGIELNWTGGKRKGLIVAWIECLESLKMIKKLSDRKQLVILLNNYFENLNMGKHARVFDTVVDAKAKDKFTTLIAT